MSESRRPSAMSALCISFLDSVKRVLATGDRPAVSFVGGGRMRIVGCCNGS
jgi:hypothetical protein